MLPERKCRNNGLIKRMKVDSKQLQFAAAYFFALIVYDLHYPGAVLQTFPVILRLDNCFVA